MRTIKSSNIGLIAVTIAIAFLCALFPLPHIFLNVRPQFVFALTLYWIFFAPERCGMGFAFCIGVLSDFILGTPLGSAALVFVLLSMFAVRFSRVFANFSILHQASVVGIFLACNAILQGWILSSFDHRIFNVYYIFSAVTTMMLWPFLSAALDYFRPRVLVHT